MTTPILTGWSVLMWNISKINSLGVDSLLIVIYKIIRVIRRSHMIGDNTGVKQELKNKTTNNSTKPMLQMIANIETSHSQHWLTCKVPQRN